VRIFGFYNNKQKNKRKKNQTRSGTRHKVNVLISNAFVRACDMKAWCKLGPSESPEAAVGRSQVLPEQVLFCLVA